MIVDGHEDVALNALAQGRDYLTSAAAIREAEQGTDVEEHNGRCMLGLADWLRGEVGIVVATVSPIPRSDAFLGELSYPTAHGAHMQGLAMLDVYERWHAADVPLEVVANGPALERVVASWDADAPHTGRRVGFVLLIENADCIHGPSETADWHARGVRLIGPAWHDSRYSGSSRSGQPLTPLGRELLNEMQRLGMAADVTHMSDAAALETLAGYDGCVVATHATARRTVDGPRLLADEVVRGIAEHDGVIGVLPVNWALVPGWQIADGKQGVSIERVADAVDVLCELTGSARHVGIGSDFDGGLGAEQAPAEIDTVADLRLIGDALSRRGYSSSDIDGIMSGNWLRVLRRVLA
ncbi:MAG: dipeptidase [Gaiellales bacterium]